MKRHLPKPYFWLALLIALFVALTWMVGQPLLLAQEAVNMTETMRRMVADAQPAENLAPMTFTPCVGGFAGSYPCENIDLLSFIPLSTFAAASGNDSWGWTDSLTGNEYALMGLNNGTGFVDITDPENPIYLGKLPTHTSASLWRDIKVYADHAFIVSEASGHGMQVFDLTQLRNVPNPPVTFAETTHYNQFGNAHNIAINEATGFAYAIGSGTCSGGLHIVNIQNPATPTNAGCFSSDGYTHDTQCVIYTGPDTTYQGHEICFNSNEDTVTIVDVTNKAAPAQLSRTPYPGSGYTHQGWLTEDQVYFLFDDELDEQSFGHNTRTRILDVSDLDSPTLIGFFDSPTPAIDHNLYTLGDYAYQANYRSGLRLLDISNVASANLTQFGYFDIYPTDSNPSFNGAWSTYPYFESGTVIISGIEQGLFMVRPLLEPDFQMATDATELVACVNSSDGAMLELLPRNGYSEQVTLSGVGLPAGATPNFSPNPIAPPAQSQLTVNVGGSVPAGAYPFTVEGTDGSLTHQVAMNLTVSDITPAAPDLSSPANGATNQPPRPTFTWQAVAQAASYTIEIATDSGFSNIVHQAAGLTTPSYTPTASLPANATLYWRVRAANPCGTGNDSAIFSFTTAICLAPAIAIPDNNPAGVSSEFTLNNTTQINDLNVTVLVNHTWVGDLILDLTHVESGTTVRFVDRPGRTTTGFGCSGDNIDATLDDEAALPVENQCQPTTPTIQGTFIPNNPLAAFDGETVAGTWRLTAIDAAAGASGQLVEWCLGLTEESLTYAATLDDSDLSVPAGQSIIHTFTLANLAASDSYSLTLSGNSWPTTLLTPANIVVPAGQTATIQVQVDVPAGANPNDVDTFTLTAVSAGNPSLSISGNGSTTVLAVIWTLYLPILNKP